MHSPLYRTRVRPGKVMHEGTVRFLLYRAEPGVVTGNGPGPASGCRDGAQYCCCA